MYFCSKSHIIIGSILFALALNFKQMSLYYSFTFFSFILGRLAVESGFYNENIKKVNNNILSKINKFLINT